jgi:N utilization substance protein B
MASNRHLGRIIVLQSLYEIGFRKECRDKSVDSGGVIKRNISRYKATLDDKSFIEELVKGVEDSGDDLDKRLQPIAPDWPLTQIARVDHIILLMGAYELLNHKEVPPKVVINEAVELAKAFGGDNSSKFINGVLGTFLREIDPTLAKKLDEETQVKLKAKVPVKVETE